MRRRALAIGIAAAALTLAVAGIRFAGAQPAALTAAARFAAIDIYVDSAEPLAAWQFELTEANGAMAVVGVENGDSDAYADAPHYDLAAVAAGRAERIVIADYSLAAGDVLPVGRTRIATVHVRLAGNRAPDFELQLIAAGNTAGQPIEAAALFELQDGSVQ